MGACSPYPRYVISYKFMHIILTASSYSYHRHCQSPAFESPSVPVSALIAPFSTSDVRSRLRPPLFLILSIQLYYSFYFPFNNGSGGNIPSQSMAIGMAATRTYCFTRSSTGSRGTTNHSTFLRFGTTLRCGILRRRWLVRHHPPMWYPS